MFTVSDQIDVYSILNNWCICINISCGCPEQRPTRQGRMGERGLGSENQTRVLSTMPSREKQGLLCAGGFLEPITPLLWPCRALLRSSRIMARRSRASVRRLASQVHLFIYLFCWGGKWNQRNPSDQFVHKPGPGIPTSSTPNQQPALASQVHLIRGYDYNFTNYILD